MNSLKTAACPMPALLCIALFWGAACSKTLRDGSCQNNEDCPSASYCSDGLCFLPSPTRDIRIIYPADNSFVSGVVTIEMEVVLPDIENVELIIDQNQPIPLKWPYKYQWNTDKLTEGRHQFYAQASVETRVLKSTVHFVEIDRTNLRISSLVPSNTARQVNARTQIIATFNKPVAAASTSTIALTVNGQRRPATILLSEEGKRLEIQPLPPLTAPSVVEIALRDIRDESGTALSADDTWQFEMPTWLLLGGPLNSYSGDAPAVAFGTNAQPTIIFTETVANTLQLHVKSWSGREWQAVGTPQRYVPPDPYSSPPGISINDRGDTFIIWSERTNNSDLVVARWNGDDWQRLPPPYPDIKEKHLFINPSIFADSNGDVVISAGRWIDPIAPNLFIATWHNLTWRQNNFYWLPINPPDTPLRELFNTSMASMVGTSSTNIYISIVAQRPEPAGHRSAATGRYDGLSFNILGPAELDPIPSVGLVRRVASVLDQSNLPVVLVEEEIYPNDNAIYVYRWNGTTWDSLPKPGYQFGTMQHNGTITLDHSGRPCIGFSAQTGGDRQCNIVLCYSNNLWMQVGPPLAVATGSTETDSPRLATNREGDLFIAWKERSPAETDSSKNLIYAAKLNK